MRFIYQQVDASLADIREDLEQLQRDSLPADSLYFPEDATWWIAYHRHHPVAFACLCPSQQGPDGVYLGRCGVLPAFRAGHLTKTIHLRLGVPYVHVDGRFLYEISVIVADVILISPSVGSYMVNLP